MSKPTSIRLDAPTEERLVKLTELTGLPRSQVIAKAINDLHAILIAREYMSDSDFIGFLAEMFAPIE